ncbi:hypothetical protein [Actinocatenispora rupis]|uniref:Phosphotransferase enzyme family protein n=1 Tax=Actinocatenispora rupis TaxID=519421 RepID=A0A8J3IWU8_9ACTN|nr:hypothetical protein [Actinocatenispora rupis]GID10148.1 hypothetical protein Aru02nite_10370 [Actinocatenispora rupis]
MSRIRPLPDRPAATEYDMRRAHDAARAIAETVLGRDPGPMTAADSLSHYVYLATEVVVKLIDADGHDRLNMETTLAPHLPPRLGAPLLATGRRRLGTCEIRYACFTRLPGTRPGVGLPGADAATVRRWAEHAVQRLDQLHTWTPTGTAEQALRQAPVIEGFTGRAALLTQIERIRAADHDALIPRPLIDGLVAIADNAPPYAAADVPVHADCDWDNWLTDEHDNTALLDFEQARLGVPADDWVLLAVTSGQHLARILDVIAERTATPPDILRAECEIRDAALIAHDLHRALHLPALPSWIAARLRSLDALVTVRRWWRCAP